MRILIADDGPELASMFERMFPREHEVVQVDSGISALERIAIGRAFDVVICEMQLPDVGGMELHRRLLECAPSTAHRVVFLTDDPAPYRAFFDGVPNLFITKPVPAGSLRQLLRDLSMR
jgi:CheY-like chemotaxis protein